MPCSSKSSKRMASLSQMRTFSISRSCEETNDNPPSAKYRLSVQEKLDLFSSLFRGRMDVFARRWYSASTGKSGYQPVCHNEWSFGLCDKKQHKCAECPNREFEPLTSEQIYRHLEGKDELARDVIGLYSILEDNTCYFLCADFDDKNCEHGYQEDVRAYTSVCKDWGIHVSIERSRSGNGAHAWIFFEKPIPAYKARRLGNALLTEAMRRDVLNCTKPAIAPEPSANQPSYSCALSVTGTPAAGSVRFAI